MAWVCAEAGKINVTSAVEDPDVRFTMALLAPGKRAIIAAFTVALSAAPNALANVIWVFRAVDVVADALVETAVEVDASDKLGVLANHPPMACSAGSAGDAAPFDAAPFAALMAVEAATAATAPCAPAGKTRLTPADVDPGAISTVAPVAVGNCASIAACTAAVSVALSGLANVI